MQHPPIDMVIGQSVTGWRLALALHVFANIAPFFSALGGYTIFLWPLAALSLLHNHRRFISRPSHSITSLHCHNNQWQLILPSSSRHQPTQLKHLPCELYGRRLVTPFLTILQFRPQPNAAQRFAIRPQSLRVVIFADAVAPKPYHQLRVRLRLTNAPSRTL